MGYHGLVTGILHPEQFRHGADLRPHGDDARRIPAVRPERHALRGQPGTQNGLRPWRLPGLHLRTKVGAKTVCKDGPVFKAEEVFD